MDPPEANAYDSYKAVLNLDPSNTEASEGIAGLVDKLSSRVWALVSEANFEEAMGLLDRPLRLLPDNQRVKDMRAAVVEVADR